MISHESSYCLDCMVSLCQITGDVHEFCHHTMFDVDGVLDANLGHEFLCHSQDLWYESAGQMDRLHVNIHGVENFGVQYKEILATLSDALINQHLNTLRPERLMKWEPKIPGLGGVDTPEAMYDPKNLGAVVGWSLVSRWVDRVKILSERVDGCRSISESEYRAWDTERRRWWREANDRAIRDLVSSGVIQDRVRVAKKPSTKAARKAAARSFNLAKKFFGEKPVKMFVEGDRVTLTGHRHDYVARKRSGLVLEPSRMGCMNLDVDVYDKNGIFCASLCVYFEDTPPLDQLVALHLTVKDEEAERELLCKSNFVTVASGFDVSEYTARDHTWADRNDWRERVELVAGLASESDESDIMLRVFPVEERRLREEHRESLICELRERVDSKLGLGDALEEFRTKRVFGYQSTGIPFRNESQE